AFRAVRADGSEFHAEISLSPVVDGDACYVTAAIREITPHARALREAEERFRLAIDEAPIGMALADLDGNFLRVNRALCDILGYRTQELMALTLQDLELPPVGVEGPGSEE